jgi:hypothetical protein
MSERPPPWEDMSTSEDWSDEERLSAARQMRLHLEQQDSLADELGLSGAQLEAVQMIRKHGHRQAYKAAKLLAQVGGRVTKSEDADDYYQEVLATVRVYRSGLPGWRRLFGV